MRSAALRFIGIGDKFIVRNGVAINALKDDFSLMDGDARLWPQTERLTAALHAANLTGESQYWSMATFYHLVGAIAALVSAPGSRS